MNSPAKKWHSFHNGHCVEIGLVQVDIGGRSDPYDRVTDLVLKHAKDVLKDALVRCAECRGGKLSSWEDDGGTFMFLIEGPDSFNNCCLAAIEMLEQLASVKREVQLSADLERSMMIRIVCDTGTVTCDPEAHITGEFVDQLTQHEQVVSAKNKVTITERLFRQLNTSLKSRFVKWKHSSELGIDLYAAGEAPVKVAIALADLPSEPATTEEDQPTQGGLRPTPGRGRALGQGWLATVSETLKSRKMLYVSAGVFLALVIVGVVHFLAGTTSQPPVPPPQQALWAEQVQSEEWRLWRKQVHEKLSADKAIENVLADALLNVKLPARPEQAADALRRDQAIGEVLMTYPRVRDLLWDRFGIDAHNFLGTGLSKPSYASNNYEKASVHEYLIKNYYADSKPVLKLTFDPIKNPEYLRMTVGEFLDKDKAPKADHDKEELVKEIGQRVKEMKEKDTTIPAVIRFARFNAVDDSRKLGRKTRQYVFASNLAEVWNTTLRDAADLSGYISEKGDTMYVWIFLPSHPTEVVPATWDQVINHLPKWLSESDKD